MNYKIYKYLDNLNIKYANGDIKEFSKLLRQYYGKQKTENIINAINRIPFGDMDSLYALKNKEFERSMVISGASEYNYFISIGKWLEDNLNLFGKTILDVGCDNGIMSCFLASLLPDSKIISIDQHETSIKIAMQLAEKLNLNNIKFQVSKLENIDFCEYDTVLEMCILHENINIDARKTLFMNFDDQVKYWENQTEKMAIDTAKLVKNNGNLISINRTDKNAYFYAWLTNLAKLNLKTDFNSLKQIKIPEGDKINNFQIIISTKENTNIKDIEQIFIANSVDFLNKAECFKHEADIKLLICAKDVIAGYKYYDKQNNIIMEYALYSSKVDPTAIYIVFKSLLDNMFVLRTYDISETQAGLKEIENMKILALKQKYKIESIKHK